MSHRRELRFAAAVALTALFVVAPARSAAAHAALVSSNPEPGERLASAPGVVLLQFGEPLVERLSEATVLAPGGQRFEGRPDDGGEGKIRVALRTNAHGAYEVRWRTVSPLDGHTISGGFRFGVGVDVEPGVSGAEGTPRGSDLTVGLFRVLEDGALLFLVGAFTMSVLARREPRLAWVPGPPVMAAAVVLAAGIVVVGGEAASGAGSWSLGSLGSYLTAGRGTARIARLAAEAVALVFVVSRRTTPAAIATAAALGALAASGHAGAVRPAWWGTGVQAVHLVAAGVWAGGILRMATLRPPGGWRAEPARELLRRFTPVALPAFVVAAAFGTLRSAEELTGVSDLWSTSYGAALAGKVAAVVAMVPLSLRAWRRRHALPRLEAGLGVTAVVLAALLAAFPLPPRRVEENEAATTAAAPSVALPRADDLTVGVPVGDELVGLTVRPARPGVNDLYLYLPSRAGFAAPRLLLLVGRQHVELEECGAGCRHARVDLAGGELVRVHEPGRFDDGAEVALPSLPAPDGTPLLSGLSERMDSLRTYRVAETLGPVDPPLEATYEFEAPDRMRFRVKSTGQENIRIGERRYSRSGPGAAWEAASAPPIDVHEFIWDQARQRAVRVVGEGQLDGVTTRVVALYAETAGGTPLWFRLWVDGEGLVRRALMHAEGHFMEHRYAGFDEPVAIHAPVGTPREP